MATECRARVLVIDDDPDIREILGYLLTTLGYDTHAAADGVEGLALFHQERYDLVLTDLGMPGLSGWEVARLAKLERAGIPVVLVTGWGDHIDLDEARGRGVDWILTKPFRAEGVQEVVGRALSGQGRDGHAEQCPVPPHPYGWLCRTRFAQERPEAVRHHQPSVEPPCRSRISRKNEK